LLCPIDCGAFELEWKFAVELVVYNGNKEMTDSRVVKVVKEFLWSWRLSVVIIMTDGSLLKKIDSTG
jgi:hypothetical protein